jgi:hypothetical protein
VVPSALAPEPPEGSSQVAYSLLRPDTVLERVALERIVHEKLTDGALLSKLRPVKSESPRALPQGWQPVAHVSAHTTYRLPEHKRRAHSGGKWPRAANSTSPRANGMDVFEAGAIPPPGAATLPDAYRPRPSSLSVSTVATDSSCVIETASSRWPLMRSSAARPAR